MVDIAESEKINSNNQIDNLSSKIEKEIVIKDVIKQKQSTIQQLEGLYDQTMINLTNEIEDY